MRKFALGVAVFGMVALLASSGFAADKKTKSAPAKGLTDAQKLVMLNNAKDALAAQEWAIFLSQNIVGKKAPAIEPDVLSFTKEGKVSSKNLLAQGYSQSNFSLTIQEDGAATWETMQVNDAGDIVFLRGDLRGSVMRGVMSMQPKKGAKNSYGFTSEAPVAPAAVVKNEEVKKAEEVKKK